MMLVKCSHCKVILAEADFAKHQCDMPLKGCKRIEVTNFYDGSYKDVRLMNGRGTDGILYTFEVVPRKAIPIIEPLSRRKVTGFPHGKRTDEDVTEPLASAYKGMMLYTPVYISTGRTGFENEQTSTKNLNSKHSCLSFPKPKD